ncbi:MAG: hypothetical protein V1703_04945 [Candidatus Altiarchaeota archaeon]
MVEFVRPGRRVEKPGELGLAGDMLALQTQLQSAVAAKKAGCRDVSQGVLDKLDLMRVEGASPYSFSVTLYGLDTLVWGTRLMAATGKPITTTLGKGDLTPESERTLQNKINFVNALK